MKAIDLRAAGLGDDPENWSIGDAGSPLPSVETLSPLERLRAFASDLERRQVEGRLKRRLDQGLWKPTATSATQLGYECERRITMGRVIPWAAEPISAQLASIFEEGDAHEKQVIRELEDELKVKVRNRGTTFRNPELEINGKIDLEVFVEGVGWVPTEVKGLQFIPGDDVEGHELADGPVALHRRYYSQLQTYQFLDGKELGLFIFKSKATGRWRAIPLAFDYERTEVLLKRAERVRDAVRAYVAAFSTVRPFTQDGPPPLDECPGGNELPSVWENAMETAEPHLPERIPDRSECGQCPFKRHCNPSEAPIDPALLVEDVDLITDLAALEMAKPQKRLYEKTYKKTKERFELTAGEVFFAGPFMVRKKPHGQGTKLVIERQQEESNGDE